VLSAVYGSRRPRRPASALEQHRAKRRSRPFRLADLGAWATRKSHDASVAAPTARARAHVPLVVRSSVSPGDLGEPARAGRLPIDWDGLLAAGFPDPRSPRGAAAALHRIAAPLVRQASAPHAGRRDRVVLVTSAGPAEGRTFIAISLALSLARDGPVLLIDADPGPTGAVARFHLAPAAGLSDALAGPHLGPDRLIVCTELDHLRLLGPGEARSDLLDRIASRRMVRLLHELLAEDRRRLILIDGPPLARPEARALALFAGQVVLVVAARTTPHGAIETALARLGERPNVSLLLNRARVTGPPS
jgi:Mrp family chromosome partitioning ATPase